MVASPITLDHVAVITPVLDAARDTYRHLGFQLTPRGEHKGPLEPGGPVERWGTGNHCAMFDGGYFEILGIIDRNRYHAHLQERLTRYAGLSLIAFGCGDVTAAAQSMTERGVPLASGLTELERDVPFEGKLRTARFRFAFLEDGFFPEAHCFWIQQLTPELLWQRELLSQPNGVVALEGATICSVAPVETAGRLERILGIAPGETTYGIRFALGRGRIDVTDSAGLAERFPGVASPAMPWVAAVTFAVEKPDHTRWFLEERGLEPHGSGASFWLPPDQAAGAILEFVAA